MTCHQTFVALNNILFHAFTCLVSHFVAFETKSLCTRERIMSVFSTKNTTQLFGLVWTISCIVAQFITISALKCWIFLFIVPLKLIFHLCIGIIIFRVLHFFICFTCFFL